MADTAPGTPQQSIKEAESEIHALEARLRAAKSRLRTLRPTHRDSSSPSPPPPPPMVQNPSTLPTHFLLLLSDSALPLGSFAFSSGLESFLAHTGLASTTSASAPSSDPLSVFLPESISSFASTSLPFMLAAYRRPEDLPRLDDELDAALVCTVGRRASVAQGRALLSLWERSFAPSLAAAAQATPAGSALVSFSKLLRSVPSSSSYQSLPPPASAHLAPLFGAVCRAVGLTAHQTAYVLVLGHARAVVSAGVRAGVLGPYQAQRVLAGPQLRDTIVGVVDREWTVPAEEAGQRVVMLDLWVGRHELLYSRIFNS